MSHILFAAALAFCIPYCPDNGSLSLNTVVIDAGHGGHDAGTVSADRRTYEKTINLKVAKSLASMIREAYPEVKVVMTRESDVFVPLNTRAAIASNCSGKLFISVHVNATARGTSAHGFSAYILGPSKKYDSYDVNLEVCKRENSVIYLEDDYKTTYKDFDDSPESQIMMQLMQNAFREQSLSFAQKVCDRMESDGTISKNWGVMQGNFAVLRLSSMPAVLLEIGFMTNPSDLAVMRRDENLEKISRSIFEAFRQYKKQYDASTALGGAQAADETSPAASLKSLESPEPAAAPSRMADPDTSAADEPSAEGIRYGTQVIASSRILQQGDPFFKGNSFVSVKVGNVYKYIIGVDADKSKAVENHKRLRSSFDGCFLVKFDVNGTEILKL